MALIELKRYKVEFIGQTYMTEPGMVNSKVGTLEIDGESPDDAVRRVLESSALSIGDGEYLPPGSIAWMKATEIK